MNKKSLRRFLRKSRRLISPSEQYQTSSLIAQQLSLMPCYQRARKIGFYWPTDGEVDISLLAESSSLLKPAATNKTWYLPLLSDVIRPWEAKRLLFQNADGERVRNKYNIVEPRYNPRHIIDPKMLDIVLVPLVGFDRSGNRLGMGQGYYDRTFSHANSLWRRPTLIGLAHNIQECEILNTEAWDRQLDMIITNKEVIRC